jgi:hypothetical protein
MPSDPSLPYVSESWRQTTVDYGPIWEIVGTTSVALLADAVRF